jgi:hypothetical protein
MNEEQPLWEGPVGRTHFMKVMPIGDNMLRGNLEIWHNSTGALVYQVEVPVKRMLEGGGDAQTFGEWQKVVASWVRNFS